MAKFVSISISGNPVVKLDSKGCATLQITAKNLSGVAFDTRPVPVSLPILKPASGAVQNKWVTIDGPPELHFDKDQEKAIVVKFDVQMKDKPKPGSYQVRVDFLSVVKPDEYDSSQAISFDVPEIKKNGTNPLVWLIPVLVVLLIGLGVGGWLLLKPKGITVPDLQGKTIPDATSTLAAVKLTLDSDHVETIQSKPEDSDKIVSQTPAANTKAKPGDSVHVKVGAEMVLVPAVTLHSFNEAQTLLAASHLSVGQVTNEANPVVASGVVFRQSPDSGGAVLTGSAVNIWVTPRTVTVPNLVGVMTGGQAWKAIQDAGLVAVLHGDQVTQFVTAQNPPPQSQAVVGTNVDVTVPTSVSCIPITRCIYFGNAARLMVNPQPTAVPRVNLYRPRPPQ